MVKQSYASPVSAAKIKKEKIENHALSEQLDEMIVKYIALSDKFTRLYDRGNFLQPEKLYVLEQHKNALKKSLDQVAKKAIAIFDN
jgi:hypothetical protein